MIPQPPDPEQAVRMAIARFAAEMKALGVTCTWTRLYNATKPTFIIAIENVTPEVFYLGDPPPDDRPE